MKEVYIRTLENIQNRINEPIALTAIYVLLMAGFSIFLPDRIIGNFFHDDSYFYIKTAQNIHDGIGSSFDGINPTNGYHLLWLWILVFFAKLNPFVGFSGIRPLLIIHAVFIAGAGLFADRLLKNHGVETGWRAVALTAIIGATGFVDLGLETPVLLLASWALIYYLSELQEKFELSLLRISIIILLSISVCLARTDAGPFVAALSIVIAIKAWGQTHTIMRVLQVISITITPAFIILLVVGFYNITTTGHFENISSYLKIYWPGTFATGWFFETIAGIRIRIIIVLLSAVSALAYLSRKFFLREINNILIAANIYVIIHIIVLLLFASGGVASWYFALSLTIVIISLVYVAFSFFCSLRSREINVLAGRLADFFLIIVIVAAVVYVSKRFVDHDRDARFAVADWLYQNISPEQPVFQVDWTGLVAYFSRRTIINGDGLINGWEYQDYLRSGRIEEYLNKKHAVWIITTQTPKEERASVEVFSRKGELIHIGSASLSKAVFAIDGHYFVFKLTDFNFDK